MRTICYVDIFLLTQGLIRNLNYILANIRKIMETEVGKDLLEARRIFLVWLVVFLDLLVSGLLGLALILIVVRYLMRLLKEQYYQKL
jgi:hypothetical protein